MKRSAVLVALVTLVCVSAIYADDCLFSKNMMKSVALHKEARELFLAGEEHHELLEQVKACQETVANICLDELATGEEHHPEAFVEMCQVAAELPTTDEARCDPSFIQSGWDLLAFMKGVKTLKISCAYFKLHAETPEQKALYGKYLKLYSKYYKIAKERKTEFFGEGGCGGHDHDHDHE